MGEKRTFQRGRKISGSPKVFRKWGDWEEGDSFVGTFKDQYVDQKYKKDVYVFEVESASFEVGDKDITGKDLALNHIGKLGKAMQNIKKGTKIELVYNGQAEMQGGDYDGELAHDVDIFTEGSDEIDNLDGDDFGPADADEDDV